MPAPSSGPEGRPRGRKRRVVRLTALAVLSALGGLGWWLLDDRLSAEEERVVGSWRVTWDDSYPRTGTVEYEFRPDRTLRVRIRNAKTGAVVSDSDGDPDSRATWRLSGGELATRYVTFDRRSRWDRVLGGPAVTPPYVERHALTPAGPGRYRWEYMEAETPPGMGRSGTFSRPEPGE